MNLTLDAQLRLMEAFTKDGISYYDLGEMFKGMTTEQIGKYYYPGDGHFTPEGNIKAAGYLAARFRSGNQ